MAEDDTRSSNDTNFFWQSKYGTETRLGTEYLTDVTDAYANQLKYRIGFYHVPSGKTVYFKAFITNYKEDFISDWKAEAVFGRTDDIYTYGATKRKVTLSFDVPASSESEAYENMGRIQRLIQFQYPAYAENSANLGSFETERIITQSPLVRISVMNLLHRPPPHKKTDAERVKIQKQSRKRMFDSYVREDTSARTGMLAAINSLSLDTDITKHPMFEKAPGTVLPQFFRVSLDFFVIHEDTIGFDTLGNSLLPNYPYDVWLKEPSDAEAEATAQNPAARTNMLLNNQAAEDIAKSRYSGLGARGRAKRDIKKAARLENRAAKGNKRAAARIQEGGFDYEMAHEAADAFKENDWEW
tara:strand:- start:754 stop:1821 length:1068 start_codon:yes stop_codon:yes gene_type:complete